MMMNSGSATTRPAPRTRRPNTTVAPVISSSGFQANLGIGVPFRRKERTSEMTPMNASSQPRTVGK